MANQTAIPVIQSQSQEVTLLQQNANKVLRNLSNKIDLNTNDINQMTIVGEIKLASLTLVQFQATAGVDWILANGQTSVGTAYETLTGNKTVPTVTVPGVTAFIKVN